MDDEVRYSFEEIESILYKQAYRIKKNFPNKYEADELVNEVWLKGGIQKLDNIKFLAARAYWDMIDYIRSVEGRHRMIKGVFFDMPKHITNFHNIKKRFGTEVENDFFNNRETKEQNYCDSVDDKDEIDHLLQYLSDKKQTILKKYFLEGMSLVDIGALFGVKGPIICSHKRKALEKIREVHNIEVREEKKRQLRDKFVKSESSLQEILPEYISDYEIDNQYALDEDLILADDRFTSEIEL